jgi:glycosyltransferase involved in cell wall biosynthesis
LYISYDGMLEPLGQSQVLAYLEKLAPTRRIHLMSFEKRSDWNDLTRRSSVAARISSAGIHWHPLRYHKSPSAPATAYDIAAGSGRAIGLAQKHRLSVVHARSYVPGLMALAVKRTTGARFLFDLRGFWADERVDGELWPANGALYRAAKNVERRLLRAADEIVTLTDASEKELRGFPELQGRSTPITVIPTWADLDRFTIGRPPRHEPFVLGYVGSVGTWYLLDEMLRCFARLREEAAGSRLLVVNRTEHERIRDKAGEYGIGSPDLELLAADHAEMPELIGRMTAGMALIKPAFSKIASAPTKLAEYLGCGVPCLGNAGVGDVEAVLEERRVGVALPGFTDEQIRSGVRRLIELTADKDVQERCRRAAVELYSLDSGVAAYEIIYRRLAATRSSKIDRKALATS